jgi:hypothetical protein
MHHIALTRIRSFLVCWKDRPKFCFIDRFPFGDNRGNLYSVPLKLDIPTTVPLTVNEYFDCKAKSIPFQTKTLPATVRVMVPGEYTFDTSKKKW